MPLIPNFYRIAIGAKVPLPWIWPRPLRYRLCVALFFLELGLSTKAAARQILYECLAVKESSFYQGRIKIGDKVLVFQVNEPRFILPDDTLRALHAYRNPRDRIQATMRCRKTPLLTYDEYESKQKKKKVIRKAKRKPALGDDMYEDRLHEKPIKKSSKNSFLSVNRSTKDSFNLGGRSGLGSEKLALSGGGSELNSKGLFQPLNLDLNYQNDPAKLYVDVGYSFHRFVVKGEESFTQNSSANSTADYTLFHQDLRFAIGYLGSSFIDPKSESMYAVYLGIDHVGTPFMAENPDTPGSGRLAEKSFNGGLLGAIYVKSLGDFHLGIQTTVMPVAFGSKAKVMDYQIDPLLAYKISDKDLIDAGLSYHQRTVKDTFICADPATTCDPDAKSTMSLTTLYVGLQISL